MVDDRLVTMQVRNFLVESLSPRAYVCNSYGIPLVKSASSHLVSLSTVAQTVAY